MVYITISKKIINPYGSDFSIKCAQHGYLQLLIWYVHNGGKLDQDVPYYATEKGCIDIIKFAISHGYNWNDIEVSPNNHPIGFDVCAHAAEYNQLSTLQWLRNNGCPWDYVSAVNAAEFGNEKILDYIYKSGGTINTDVVCAAFESGHINIVKYLHNIGMSWDSDLFGMAVFNDNNDLVKYLFAEGCPVSVYAATYAAQNGNLEILQFLITNGCPYDDNIYDTEYENVLDWLHEDNLHNSKKIKN